MAEVTLPSGRVVNVELQDTENIRVTWTERDVQHTITAKKGISAQELDEFCNRYLYGYDDPETGEHVPGYFELMEQSQTQNEDVLVS